MNERYTSPETGLYFMPTVGRYVWAAMVLQAAKVAGLALTICWLLIEQSRSPGEQLIEEDEDD